MSRLGGWFGAGKKTEDASPSALVSREKENLSNAMKWVELIMDDDIDGAWEKLQQGDSSFHDLGSAITFFMRSVLGFEKSVMTEATARLADCETRAWADLKRAQKHGAKYNPDSKYPPGTEYELVIAQAQLMGAVVGVLHESLVEAMKSFYRLRKAFLTLDAIIASEAKLASRGTPSGSTNHLPTSVNGNGNANANGTGNGSGEKTPESETNSSSNGTPNSSSSGLVSGLDDLALDESRSPSPLRIKSAFVELESSIAFDNPVDGFIHSGANMCFGILLLILSLVPPAFSRILAVVGFQGDRPRAVKMLWRSASHHNINGAVSGMMLLAYYNGLLGAADILPHQDDYDEAAEAVGPPIEKCARLLSEMRSRYPDSRLWRVEEARMRANERNLPKAIELLQTGKDSKMKQVAALNNFELSINAMVCHDWKLMRDQFLQCLDINDWSPAMYYYMAGCASLELYRDAFHADDKAEAKQHKSKAEEYFRKAPSLAGKKRLMAKQMPLETFLQRKIEKWEARAKSLGIDLADAVGTSPALEMSYVWNGQKRMGPHELQEGVRYLQWKRCTALPEAVRTIKAEKDEMAVWALGMASLLRGMEKYNEARAMLKEHILDHERHVFKGATKDDYVLPSAHYEMGAIAWAECCAPPQDTASDPKARLEYRRAKLHECEERLNIVKNWETFVLDARIGMRATSGLETLGWFKRKMGWEA
ncbi:Mitochondrial outer membrane protein iml-2 [Escovopsis weberi]|uniref:Inclusion body clearance protein IML2 n=1 Tax=Escovopsis weberi TaxID=150374 RepID=A0A0M8N8X0_ESCWE|nr:Mitochondrial outer membrane protein iml-2 [Escovopsis weberi]